MYVCVCIRAWTYQWGGVMCVCAYVYVSIRRQTGVHVGRGARIRWIGYRGDMTGRGLTNLLIIALLCSTLVYHLSTYTDPRPVCIIKTNATNTHTSTHTHTGTAGPTQRSPRACRTSSSLQRCSWPPSPSATIIRMRTTPPTAPIR